MTEELRDSGNQTATSRMTGGRAVAEMMRVHEVGPIFGMGGFQLLPFYEGLRSLGIRHILVNDERVGGFAADAYARATGRPGVCDATLGPGAMNLVTPLVESLNAGVPIVAVVGDTHRSYSSRNMTQEGRQTEILTPACKSFIRVEVVERIPELMRRAFSVATSGRPGPVVVAVPEDIAHAEHDFPTSDFWAEPSSLKVPSRRTRPDAESVAAAAEVLSRASRPVILAGGGVHLSGAYGPLHELASSLNIPVAHTLSGKGAIACIDPLSVGLFGRFSRYANELIDSSDCLVAVGCKLGEIATKRYTLFRPGVPLIQLDIEPEEIGRWSPVAVGLWGDARAGLEDLVAAVGPKRTPPARRELWQEVERRRQAWLEEATPRYLSDETPIDMARLVHELNQLLSPESVLVADGGFASHWAGLLYDTKQAGRGFVADRGLASIGYGLPGGIGTRLGRPASPVVAITGDSALNMTIGDLETARRAGVGFALIVVNNAASGYVKALQHAVYGEGHYESSDLEEVDYSRVAQAYGCLGIRVEDPSELAPALSRALGEQSVPVVVDVVVTRDPARMLPAVDNRTLTVAAGDRPV